LSRNCSRCGQPFETDRAHHRLCWACYWELRDTAAGRGNWRTPPPGWDDPPRQDRERPQQTVRLIDERLLRDAISLTHPDRHPPERARIANAVTAALLELLDAARRAA
jgi:hypothetical protein